MSEPAVALGQAQNIDGPCMVGSEQQSWLRLFKVKTETKTIRGYIKVGPIEGIKIYDTTR